MQEIRKLYFLSSPCHLPNQKQEVLWILTSSLNIMKLRYYENSYQNMSKGNLIRSPAVLNEDREFRINRSSIIYDVLLIHK